jgi:DNA-binding response OmpR family regulator
MGVTSSGHVSGQFALVRVESRRLAAGVRILVVEDEKKVAALIHAGLAERGYPAEVCYDGDSAERLLAQGGFDAVVLDVMLPGRDGLSVLRRLRAAKNAVPVLLVTARGGVEERVEGLELGADDYLAKPFVFSELLARLRAIPRRQSAGGLGVQSCADLQVNLATRETRRGEVKVVLTAREFAVLECLLRAGGQAVTRVELVQSVWGHNFDAGTNFVDVAIQRLRRKIDDPFSVKLIQTVRGLGYALQAPS